MPLYPPFMALLAWSAAAILLAFVAGICFLILAGAWRLVFPSKAALEQLGGAGTITLYVPQDVDAARAYFESIGAKVAPPPGAYRTADGRGPAPGLPPRTVPS